MLVAIDVETAPRPEFSDFEDAALIPHMAQITVIGAVTDTGERKVFRGPSVVAQLEAWLWGATIENIGSHRVDGSDIFITGHNFKFDLKHMLEHGGSPYLVARWHYDSQLMGHIHSHKIPEPYLEDYERFRRIINKRDGVKHREAGKLSLKSMAPYFLSVDPFWETPGNHDNDEYVLKDAEYTLRLTQYFQGKLTGPELSFFNKRQLPWTKMLLTAERRGICLDEPALLTLGTLLDKELLEIESKIETTWAKEFKAYEEKERNEIIKSYEEMAQAFLASHPKADPNKVKARYTNLRDRCLENSSFKLNLSSPTQLTWLLETALGYDIRNFAGDKTTDKEVLQKLSGEGKKDVALLLHHRETSKIRSAYIPNYATLRNSERGTIHPSFNPAGTKTGRLSCALPNLQQCPAEIRSLFRPREGCVFITKDFSMLEPVLIGYYTQDPLLKEIIQTGQSFHSVNAKLMFNLSCPEGDVKKLYPAERDAAKEAGLSILYGAGANRLMQSLQKRGFHFSLDRCKAMVRELRSSYATVWEFKTALDRALESGETIYNFLGRPIHFENPEDVYMKGFNSLIQGSGSDILQQSSFDITQDPECMGVNPLLLVHDELVAEVSGAFASHAEKRIDYHMTKFDLGDLKLHTEGGIANEWRK